MTKAPSPNEDAQALESWIMEVIAGPDRGRTFPLHTNQSLLIGRGSQSHTQIRDPSISRVHCEINWVNGHPQLVDQGGSGGTLVEGKCIESALPLTDGLEMTLGETRLGVRIENGLDAATMAQPAAVSSPPVTIESESAEVPPEVAITRIRELEGHTFLRFKLEELIRVGQTSIMFRGVDLKHDRAVAVKILRPNMVSTEAQKERFIRAMRTMLPIQHPNIVRTRKAERSGTYCWAAFDWVDGMSVAELIETIGISGMLDWREVLRVAVHIGRALEEAAKHQVVHRNVTPSNLMRRQSDQAFLLTDLIFARALEYTAAPQLTRPGEVVGELGYVPPERILDSTQIDAKGDQYSLGATLYALLTGVPPYDAIGLGELIEQHHSVDPQHPAEFQMGLNRCFCDVVMKMIHKNPQERFSSAATLLRELELVAKQGGVDADWVRWQG